MKPLSVSQITKQIKDLLEWNFSEVFVEGEISNLKFSSSKHIYFNLVDSKSALKCVIFKSNVNESTKQLTDGQKVIALGRLGVYEPYGEYHLIVSFIQGIGDGLKYKKLEEDKKFLLEKGYLENKRQLPMFPKRVIVVTSPHGAAIRDILNILKRRSSGLEIIIYPTTVQGDNAKKEILEAIEFVNKNYSRLNLDVCILTRGGGSIDDLWVFNDLDIAIAYKNCAIPTISAIGHQIDQTLCDLVADIAAETPSAAAELLTKAWVSANEAVSMLEKAVFSNFKRILNLKTYLLAVVWSERLVKFMNNYIEIRMLKVDNLCSHIERQIQNILFIKDKQLKYTKSAIIHQHPINKLHLQKQTYLRYKDSLITSIQKILFIKKHSIENLESKINALSPHNVLKRGFSITYTQDNKIVRSNNDIEIGETIYTRLAFGSIESIVSKKHLVNAKIDTEN